MRFGGIDFGGGIFSCYWKPCSIFLLGEAGFSVVEAYFSANASFRVEAACELCPKSRARLSRFILLVSFSDTLLVVSILDILYDCYLRRLLQS